MVMDIRYTGDKIAPPEHLSGDGPDAASGDFTFSGFFAEFLAWLAGGRHIELMCLEPDQLPADLKALPLNDLITRALKR